MSEPLDDRVEDFVYHVVLWPLNIAQGRHWLGRLAALTLGWLWIFPAMLLVGVPLLFLIVLPVMIWNDLAEKEAPRG